MRANAPSRTTFRRIASSARAASTPATPTTPFGRISRDALFRFAEGAATLTGDPAFHARHRRRLALPQRHPRPGRPHPRHRTGPDRSYRARLESLLACPVDYDADEDTIVFDRATWDMRPATTHPAFATLFALVAEPVAAAFVPTPPLAATVACVTEERLADGGLNVAQVATILGIEGRAGDVIDQLRVVCSSMVVERVNGTYQIANWWTGNTTTRGHRSVVSAPSAPPESGQPLDR